MSSDVEVLINRPHPDKERDEVFVGNFSDDDYPSCRWQTKRPGTHAYDTAGRPMVTGFPVFVKRDELEAAGYTIQDEDA